MDVSVDGIHKESSHLEDILKELHPTGDDARRDVNSGGGVVLVTSLA